jgi:hypothetical protein
MDSCRLPALRREQSRKDVDQARRPRALPYSPHRAAIYLNPNPSHGEMPMEHIMEIQEQVQRVLVAELALAKAKEEFAQEKEKLRLLIAGQLQNLPKSDAQKLASELYWQRRELGGLVRKAHKSPGKFKPLPVQIRVTCTDCKQSVQILAHHWGAAESLWGRCDTCEHRRSHKDEQRQHSIQAYLRRMKDREDYLRSMPYAEYLRTPDGSKRAKPCLNGHRGDASSATKRVHSMSITEPMNDEVAKRRKISLCSVATAMRNSTISCQTNTLLCRSRYSLRMINFVSFPAGIN